MFIFSIKHLNLEEIVHGGFSAGTSVRLEQLINMYGPLLLLIVYVSFSFHVLFGHFRRPICFLLLLNWLSFICYISFLSMTSLAYIFMLLLIYIDLYVDLYNWRMVPLTWMCPVLKQRVKHSNILLCRGFSSVCHCAMLQCNHYDIFHGMVVSWWELKFNIYR